MRLWVYTSIFEDFVNSSKMSARSGFERDGHFVRDVVAAPGAATTLPIESGQRQNVADQTTKSEK